MHKIKQLLGKQPEKKDGPATPAPLPSPTSTAPPSDVPPPRPPRQHQYGTNLLDDFELVPNGMLGGGQFGIVKAATNKVTGANVAVKVIEWRKLLDNEMTRPENLKAELTLLKTLRHEGIICLEHVYHTATELYLVMERAFGGDFLDRILNSPGSHLDERHSKFFMYQIVHALVYLHENNVAHRDLKPENVLLSTKDEFTQTKLCDFGFARIVGEDSFMKSLVGTRAYVAPEVLTAGGQGGYKLKVDIWSVGVVAYVALSGTFPFSDEDMVSPRALEPHNLYPNKHWKDVSDDAKEWLLRCFALNPNDRFSAQECLEDKWLQDKQLKADLLALEKKCNIKGAYQTDKWIHV
eukprot:comp12778_c0_seq1/m.7908 comp12778_c0_seq1/g.7908  ORF comp12778_c0_seq1/g.7908 comp12778_c0_seq1/m.7908 type:complete len:351 (-) comp12778_c0_seq1:77-1129(-)